MNIEPDKHWFRPFGYLIICLFLLLIWAGISEGCRKNDSLPGAGMVSTGGSSVDKKGSGNSDSGDGPGAGIDGKDDGSTGKSTTQSGTVKVAANTNAPPTAESNSSSMAAQSSANTNGTAQTVKLQAIESLTSPRQQSASNDLPPADYNSNSAGRKGFYGIASHSKGRVLFIIDTSGSMAGPSGEFPGKSRIDVLKMELKKYIFGGQKLTPASYKRGGSFVIAAFNSSTTFFPDNGSCRNSNHSDMKKTEEFIDSLQANGGTMMRDAWQRSFELIKKQKIDTVFFLTDGEAGDGFSSKWLLDELKKISHTKPVVHCIRLGGRKNEDMEMIAKKRNGKFIALP